MKGSLSNLKVMKKTKYGETVQIDLICNMCGARCPMSAFISSGKPYEGHFSANRFDEDMMWSADLCPECQEDVGGFIEDIAAEKNAKGLEKTYKDPMGQ